MSIQHVVYITSISLDLSAPIIPVKKNDPDESGSGTVIAKYRTIVNGGIVFRYGKIGA
jgi:hypothetical protein